MDTWRWWYAYISLWLQIHVADLYAGAALIHAASRVHSLSLALHCTVVCNTITGVATTVRYPQCKQACHPARTFYEWFDEAADGQRALPRPPPPVRATPVSGAGKRHGNRSQRLKHPQWVRESLRPKSGSFSGPGIRSRCPAPGSPFSSTLVEHLLCQFRDTGSENSAPCAALKRRRVATKDMEAGHFRARRLSGPASRQGPLTSAALAWVSVRRPRRHARVPLGRGVCQCRRCQFARICRASLLRWCPSLHRRALA
jgi:hypothetical protein